MSPALHYELLKRIRDLEGQLVAALRENADQREALKAAAEQIAKLRAASKQWLVNVSFPHRDNPEITVHTSCKVEARTKDEAKEKARAIYPLATLGDPVSTDNIRG